MPYSLINLTRIITLLRRRSEESFVVTNVLNKLKSFFATVKILWQ